MIDWSQFEPAAVWRLFGELVAVPRPSKQETQAMQWVRAWAAKHGYPVVSDAAGNVVVRVPGKGKLRNGPPVILQGHVDIVVADAEDAPPEVDSAAGRILVELGAPDAQGHFRPSPDGGWIGAPYSTLGADNGIGCAMGMAIAEDPDAVHGPLELLFTVDEEQGMTGALELDPQALGLTAKRLINLDTEDDDELTIGCAGGMDTEVRFPGSWSEVAPGETVTLRVLLKDLRGGHSGVEIHSGRANAIRCLARALRASGVESLRIAAICGGEKRNAIPRRAEAVVTVAAADRSSLESSLQEAASAMMPLFEGRDFPLRFQVEQVESASRTLTQPSTGQLLDLLIALHHGVFNVTAEIPDLVETSNNVATVEVQGDDIVIGCNSRSSMEAGMDDVADAIDAAARLAGASSKSFGRYPGWKPNLDSPLLNVTKSAYEKLFGESPHVSAIHAGLECGVLGDKLPGLDSISFGPNIRGNHAPGEHVEIASVQKTYRLLREVLANLT